MTIALAIAGALLVTLGGGGAAGPATAVPTSSALTIATVPASCEYCGGNLVGQDDAAVSAWTIGYLHALLLGGLHHDYRRAA